MKVILTQDVKGQGKKGDVINVNDGYARNYLLPKNLAAPASAASLNAVSIQKAAKTHHEEQQKKLAKETAKILEGSVIELSAKAGEGGKLFGSITSKEIAAAIKQSKGLDVDKRDIILEDPIKHTGDFSVSMHLAEGVSCRIIIKVAGQGRNFGGQ
ncbi:MAG: 50S ribosomal protein L9 [Bacillota bacterium]|nr:50S ribosomal protein L9 [Bacillota bacterium]